MEAIPVVKEKTAALSYAGSITAPYVKLIKILGRPEKDEDSLFEHFSYRWDFILTESEIVGYFTLWSAEPWVKRRKQSQWHVASSEVSERAKSLIMKLLKGDKKDDRESHKRRQTPHTA